MKVFLVGIDDFAKVAHENYLELLYQMKLSQQYK